MSDGGLTASVFITALGADGLDSKGWLFARANQDDSAGANVADADVACVSRERISTRDTARAGINSHVSISPLALRFFPAPAAERTFGGGPRGSDRKAHV